ncbi:MAG TPA: hypothetical protein DEG92_02350 [Rikenellaceae bacterium]|nr:hypothetical protein [Rikenellaceae bacterium]
MNKNTKILHLEDSVKDAELIRAIIDNGGIGQDYILTDSKEKFIDILKSQDIDIILCDYSLPDIDGNEALNYVKENHSEIPFIFVSGSIGEDKAIESMINGATDYVLKHKLERLVPAIKRALHERDLENMHIKSDGKIKLKNKKIEIQNKKLSQFNRDLILQNEENAKQAEELIVAKEMAEENDRLKTAFLQNMSHEIRTPLNGIIGFSDLLNSEDITRAEIISYTGIITQSGKRLMEIINNILDISRIQTGQIKIEKKLILINSLFFDLLSFFSPLARKKNINLSCPNLDNKGIILYSDELKLHQIFVNLINNAIKFTKSGEINFGCREEGDFVKFYVKDTGIGIPKELYDKIFDRFIQVEKSLSRDHEGAGLGLAISRGFVELLGGKIWVESEIGKNTTFYFNLPSVKDATNISSYVTLSD